MQHWLITFQTGQNESSIGEYHYLCKIRARSGTKSSAKKDFTDLKIRLILLFTGLFLAAGSSAGQIIKVQAGMNWSFIEDGSGKPVQGFGEPFTGFCTFIGIDYLNLELFNLSSNIGYLTKKGEESYWSLRPNGGSDLITNKTDLGYLSFNTAFNLKYPVRDLIIPYISAGPRIDYLIKDSSESRWDILKPAIFGTTMGGGLICRISGIEIGLRYDHYLNFNKNSELRTIPGYSGFIGAVEMTEKTSLLSITIAYKLK